jgi:hypothetical protein
MVRIVPTSLDELCALGTEPWRANLVLGEIGGGRATEADLDVLASQPDATAITVSGLDQPTFEALIERYGSQFVAMHFWKCPRVNDLSPLERLPQLRFVSFYWNQRATRLWDFTQTPDLQGAVFDDFTRLHDLSDLSAARSLQDLRIGDKVWDSAVLESLEPLTPLVQLESLRFGAKRLVDGSVEPLASLRGLKRLKISYRQFTTQQLAWLRVHLPAGIECDALEPVRHLDKGFEYGGKLRDVLLVGKGKPYLNSGSDAKRINRHVDEFWRFVERYEQNPSLEPE